LCATSAYTRCVATTRDDRIALRVTNEQGALIRRAAEVSGQRLTDFAVSALVSRARDVLADQRYFLLDDQAWAEFETLLDRPADSQPRLADLFQRPSVFHE